jgi:hypothetical protein
VALKDGGDEGAQRFHRHARVARQAVNPVNQLQSRPHICTRNHDRFDRVETERNLVWRNRNLMLCLVDCHSLISAGTL